MLEITDLTLDYPKGRAEAWTVLSSFSLQVSQGEIVGLVGESGSGKTSVALATLGLLDSTARLEGGEIRWRGRNLLSLGERELRAIRGKRVALIFQQPQAALNPVLPAGEQIMALLELHRGLKRDQREAEALALLERTGIPEPRHVLGLFPHQLSGGMAQRVMIAMALACGPELLIADEPTASLDVTIQAQIMDLLLEIREQTGMAILLISHDLGVVSDLCDTVAVIYRGRVVEKGPAAMIRAEPAHPYTRALMDAIPGLGRRTRPSVPPRRPDLAVGWDRGCAYADRCPRALQRCFSERPPVAAMAERHAVSCWLMQEGHDAGARDNGTSSAKGAAW